MSRRRWSAAAALRRGVLTRAGAAQSLEKITYLFPGAAGAAGVRPDPAGAGQGLLQGGGLRGRIRGRAAAASTWRKQVGAGNAPLGGIVADGPIMVRGNGVPVKIVCVFGGKASCNSWCARTPASRSRPTSRARPSPRCPIRTPPFYALLGLMASAGPDAERRQRAAGRPDRRLAVRRRRQVAGHGWRAGLDSADHGGRREGEGSSRPRHIFPHMAQAIAASDDIIKQKPEMVRKFVTRALRGMKDMMDNPDKAADEFVSFVPDGRARKPGRSYAFNMYAKDVYPGRRCSAR
jgi:NitT/TauT family transport system substrate-binding protein